MSDDTTAAFRPCATCGGDLRINEPVDGLIFTIRDNRGEHHSVCWGKPERDAIAAARNEALEEAARVADVNGIAEGEMVRIDDDPFDAADAVGKRIAAAIRHLRVTGAESNP